MPEIENFQFSFHSTLDSVKAENRRQFVMMQENIRDSTTLDWLNQALNFPINLMTTADQRAKLLILFVFTKLLTKWNRLSRCTLMHVNVQQDLPSSRYILLFTRLAAFIISTKHVSRSTIKENEFFPLHSEHTLKLLTDIQIKNSQCQLRCQMIFLFRIYWN